MAILKYQDMSAMRHDGRLHDYSIKGSHEYLWNLGSIFIHDFNFIVPKIIFCPRETSKHFLIIFLYVHNAFNRDLV